MTQQTWDPGRLLELSGRILADMYLACRCQTRFFFASRRKSAQCRGDRRKPGAELAWRGHAPERPGGHGAFGQRKRPFRQHSRKTNPFIEKLSALSRPYHSASSPPDGFVGASGRRGAKRQTGAIGRRRNQQGSPGEFSHGHVQSGHEPCASNRSPGGSLRLFASARSGGWTGHLCHSFLPAQSATFGNGVRSAHDPTVCAENNRAVRPFRSNPFCGRRLPAGGDPGNLRRGLAVAYPSRRGGGRLPGNHSERRWPPSAPGE